MADDVSGFDDRYRLGGYELEVIGRKADDGDDATETESTGSWIANGSKTPLSEFNPYRVNDFSSKGKLVRINYELYKELFGGSASEGEMLYQKRPAKLVIRHANRRWWNPFTGKKTYFVDVLTGRALKKYPNGIAGQYVSTIGFNKNMMPTISRRKDGKTETVSISISAMNVPLWRYFVGATPNEGWNLSVLFFWLSAVYGLIGEGYKWPDHVRDGLDWLGFQIMWL